MKMPWPLRRRSVGFAKRTGKKTIAEFVHSEAVHDLVREMGVDYSQGYYLGKAPEAARQMQIPRQKHSAIREFS